MSNFLLGLSGLVGALSFLGWVSPNLCPLPLKLAPVLDDTCLSVVDRFDGFSTGLLAGLVEGLEVDFFPSELPNKSESRSSIS